MKALKFHATWCGPCKALSMVVEGVDNLPLEIESIDIDENMALAQKYGVRSVPTIVIVDSTGTEVKRKTGSMNESQLLEFLKV